MIEHIPLKYHPGWSLEIWLLNESCNEDGNELFVGCTDNKQIFVNLTLNIKMIHETDGQQAVHLLKEVCVAGEMDKRAYNKSLDEMIRIYEKFKTLSQKTFRKSAPHKIMKAVKSFTV